MDFLPGLTSFLIAGGGAYAWIEARKKRTADVLSAYQDVFTKMLENQKTLVSQYEHIEAVRIELMEKIDSLKSELSQERLDCAKKMHMLQMEINSLKNTK